MADRREAMHGRAQGPRSDDRGWEALERWLAEDPPPGAVPPADVDPESAELAREIRAAAVGLRPDPGFAEDLAARLAATAGSSPPGGGGASTVTGAPGWALGLFAALALLAGWWFLRPDGGEESVDLPVPAAQTATVHATATSIASATKMATRTATPTNGASAGADGVDATPTARPSVTSTALGEDRLGRTPTPSPTTTATATATPAPPDPDDRPDEPDEPDETPTAEPTTTSTLPPDPTATALPTDTQAPPTPTDKPHTVTPKPEPTATNKPEPTPSEEPEPRETPIGPEPDCEERCKAERNAAMERCADSSDPEQCRREAQAAFERCIDECP